MYDQGEAAHAPQAAASGARGSTTSQVHKRFGAERQTYSWHSGTFFLALGIGCREAFRSGFSPIKTRCLALARNLTAISFGKRQCASKARLKKIPRVTNSCSFKDLSLTRGIEFSGFGFRAYLSHSFPAACEESRNPPHFFVPKPAVSWPESAVISVDQR